MRNKPKSPRSSTPDTTAHASTSRPTQDNGPADMDVFLTGRIRPDDSSALSSGLRTRTPAGETSHPAPALTVTPIAAIDLTQGAIVGSVLERYVQTPGNELTASDADGLRFYNKRRFVDVASDKAESGLQTVMVAFDETMKAYRAKLPTERQPSGPPLYRIADSNAWSLHKPIEYYEHREYTSSFDPDSQGYYAVHEKLDRIRKSASGAILEYGLPRMNIGFAFKDENGRLIRVDRLQARGETSAPLKLANWTDGEIWQLYRLRESEALVFRSEAEALGRAPDWATRVEEPDSHKFLTDSLRWSHPQKSLHERTELLRSYNLSIVQRDRLRKDMAHGVFPEWAEQHKLLTQSSDNRRLDNIVEELDAYILRLRNGGESLLESLPSVEKRYTDDFLESYLEHAGYKRNVHNYLYRTDIPAMFRADLRTPFELARDKRMVKLRGNPSDSTTKRAFSATFGLDDALNYMGFAYYSNPRHYNSQANRYPGHFSDSDSSGGHRHSTDGESDTSFEMDNSRDYPLLRREQQLGFLYVIDTRGIEVVPRVENLYLNDMDFDGDRMEGRISMPTRGISAERIWLVHSDFTRAARVEDVLLQAGDNAEAIERATWAGNDEVVGAHLEELPGNEFHIKMLNRYDQLIDEIASSGGVVLDLPKGRDTVANDVAWQVPEHYRP